MNSRCARHPRLNWLARWGCGVVALLCVFDFYAAERYEYVGTMGLAGPVVYGAGGRVVSLAWSPRLLDNPRSTWFRVPQVIRLQPIEMRSFHWQWWPIGHFKDGWVTEVGTAGGPLPFLCVPTWMIALLAATLSGMSWRAWWRDRHRRRGLCAKCGYDRSGLRDGAMCPECGTPPVS